MDKQPTTPLQQSPNDPQPVAYDSQGRPLYAAPPVQMQAAPQVVHLSRAVEPVEQPISPEVKKRHDESMRAFPHLNLSDGEFIISAVRRHPIGLLLPVGVTVFMVALTASLMINYTLISESMGLIEPPNPGAIFRWVYSRVGLYE
jgi:hypothetical protein